MDEEELKLIEKFKRLSFDSRRSALAQIIELAEFEERVRKQDGVLPGSSLAQTAVYGNHEWVPGLGIHST
jgi:hypothetical protein